MNVTLTASRPVIVCLRMYTRIKHSKFGYDDWITFVCWFVFLVTAIPVTVVTTWGFGENVYDIPATERPRAREGQVIGTAFVILSFASPKFGIMATVQRATNPPSGFWQRTFYANWVLCTASFIFLLGVSIFQFAQCTPVAYQWTLTGSGHCIDPEVNIRLAYASSAFSTVLDFYFSLLPAAIIWKLQMSPRTRATMSVVLGGASLATIASIVKMWKLGDAISQISDDPTCTFPKLSNYHEHRVRFLTCYRCHVRDIHPRVCGDDAVTYRLEHRHHLPSLQEHEFPAVGALRQRRHYEQQCNASPNFWPGGIEAAQEFLRRRRDNVNSRRRIRGWIESLSGRYCGKLLT